MNATTISQYALCTCGQPQYAHQLGLCPGRTHRRFEAMHVAPLAPEACGPACKSGSMGAGHLYCPPAESSPKPAHCLRCGDRVDGLAHPHNCPGPRHA